MTDGGSNFIKAFTETLNAADATVEIPEDDNNEKEEANVEEKVEEGQEQNDDTHIFVPEAIGNTLDVLGPHLPRREECSAHKLI